MPIESVEQMVDKECFQFFGENDAKGKDVKPTLLSPPHEVHVKLFSEAGAHGKRSCLSPQIMLIYADVFALWSQPFRHVMPTYRDSDEGSY